MMQYLYGLWFTPKREDTKVDDQEETLKEYVIGKMQKKDKEILIRKGLKTETWYYAAERLKRVKEYRTTRPDKEISNEVLNKLVDIAQFCPTVVDDPKAAEKVRGSMKIYADYLSEHVTIPDQSIEALLALFGQMEASRDNMLTELEGKIKKTNKEALFLLKRFTSIEDKINKPDRLLQGHIQGKMRRMMSSVPPKNYEPEVLNLVINEQARLLSSFLVLQGEKTAALKVLLDKMETKIEETILNFGNVKKTFNDAFMLLHNKTSDQLMDDTVPDPLVRKKIENKISSLLQDTTDAEKPYMKVVIDEAIQYLAIQLVQSQVLLDCKCPKTVFVDCGKDEKGELRTVERPYCSCNQQDSSGPSKAQIDVIECPTMASCKRDGPRLPCPTQKPDAPCPAAKK